MPRAPDWQKNPTLPTPGAIGASARVEGDLRVGVDDPETVRTDDPHPARPRQGDQLPLRRLALRTGLGETAGHYDETAHALLGALLDDVAHRARGGRDHGEVHVVGDVEHRGVGADAGDVRALGVHGVDRPLEAGGEDVVEQHPADALPVASGTDDGDRPRVQQPIDRPCLGAVLPRLHHAQRLLGLLDRELQMDDAVLEGAAGLVAGVDEAPTIARLPGRMSATNRLMPRSPPGGGQVFEQHRPRCRGPGAGPRRRRRPPPRRCREDTVVAADRDEVTGQRADQPDAVAVVDVGEALHLLVGELPVVGEEALVDGLGRQPGVQLPQPVGVVGPDRPQVAGAAVGEHHVGFPVGGVVSHGRPRGRGRAAARSHVGWLRPHGRAGRRGCRHRPARGRTSPPHRRSCCRDRLPVGALVRRRPATTAASGRRLQPTPAASANLKLAPGPATQLDAGPVRVAACGANSGRWHARGALDQCRRAYACG